MQSARPDDIHQASAQNRVAASAATRSSPLTIVSGAVAGDDLASVASAVSDALGQPVVVAIPALGEPVASSRGAVAPDGMRAIVAHALGSVRGEAAQLPPMIADAVPVRIGPQVVGIVAAVIDNGARLAPSERQTWLEAGAAAAAVAALLRDPQWSDDCSAPALFSALRATPVDAGTVIHHARRLGIDLSAGAVALCAAPGPGVERAALPDLLAPHGALLTEIDGGRLLGLIPLDPPLSVVDDDDAGGLARDLSGAGMLVAMSAPRRDAGALHDAIREAELLLELTASPGAALHGQEDTYRLLIGVLLRSEEELELLRAGTVSSLADYDARHDTDLLATLHAFLAHDGSTTDTAEQMQLHRHTVGYRLARLHEVSGLSPYESDGRERLSLGLKAHHILEAHRRLREAGSG